MRYKFAAVLEVGLICVLVVVGLSLIKDTIDNVGAARSVDRAMSLFYQDRPDLAREGFLSAVAIQPEYAPGHQSLVYLALSTASFNPQDVQASIDRLLALSGGKGPLASAAWIGAGHLKLSRSGPPESRDEYLGRLADADTQFQLAEKADPGNADPTLNRGIAAILRYETTKDPAALLDATGHLSRADAGKSISILGIYPKCVALGRLYLISGRRENAVTEMLKSAALDARGNDGLINLLTAYSQLVQSPSLGTPQARMAIVNEVDAFIRRLENETRWKDIRSHAVFPTLWNAMGVACAEAGGPRDRSQWFFERQGQEFPDRTEALVNLGLLHFSVGQPPEAARFLFQATTKGRLAPAVESRCLNALALCRRQLASTDPSPKVALDSCETYLAKAVALDPQNWAAARNLGILFYEKKDWRSALAYFKRSLGSRPNQEDLRSVTQTLETPPRLSNPRFLIASTQTAPEGKDLINEELPSILLTVQMPYPQGVDPAGTRIGVDGKPQAFWEFVTPDEILLKVQDPLADGKHRLDAEFQSATGQVAQTSWDFSVDLAPPTITWVQPERPIARKDTVFVFEVADSASGVNFSKISVRLRGLGPKNASDIRLITDGKLQKGTSPDPKGDLQLKASPVRFLLPSARIPGKYEITVEVQDNGGQSARTVFAFDFAE